MPAPRGEGTITVPAIAGVWLPTGHTAALTSSSSSVSPAVESGGQACSSSSTPRPPLRPVSSWGRWERQV